MQLNFDIEKLQELMRDFYILTRIKIVVFDAQYNELISYPTEHCAFCNQMQNSPETSNKCRESNVQAFEECRRNQKLIVYHCHAGLVEATAPLKDNGVTIGYFMFGQITDVADRESFTSHISSMCERYGLSSVSSKTAVEKSGDVGYHSEEQIQATAKILEACTYYVLLNQLISKQKERFVYRLNQFIDTHLHEVIPTASICAEFGINRTRLYSLCGQHLGEGLAEYVKTRRLMAARRLLSTTDMTIAEISEKIGFSDYNYFCRVFKSEEGLPARKYRALYQEDKSL